MKSSNDLRTSLRAIDYKGYPAYKSLAGSYQFDRFILAIDHVQGDPFASPSSLHVEIFHRQAGFPSAYLDSADARIALADHLTRCLSAQFETYNFKAKGSGKSGLISTTHCGQEVLERTACEITKEGIHIRFFVGFPANGRTINSGELEKILFVYLPKCVEMSLYHRKVPERETEQVICLKEDQRVIREELKKRGLIAFVANGSILPRQSGNSDLPMKDAVPFQSPKSMEITIQLRHRGSITGMGIRKGITLIVGGGYHGKSTLLKALEFGVYNHIAGDGREYVITDDKAMKIRAEDGRSIQHVDISMFIRNLPNGKNTKVFCTEDASGSTSQAANVVEAMEAGSQVLLIDEDTSATNFMIRDELMQRVVHKEKEPIIPYIDRIRELYEKDGVSTILVAGSCGAFFHVADTVIQMEKYVPKEITERAKKMAAEYPLKIKDDDVKIQIDENRRVKLPKADDRTKIKVMGTDGFLYNKTNVDLRYLEQITDAEQMLAISKTLEYLIRKYGGKEISIKTLIDDVQNLIDTKGVSALTSRGSVPNMSKPRRFEVAGCLNRFVK